MIRPLPGTTVLIAVLDPELYLKSRRTRGSMIRRLIDNLLEAFGGDVAIDPVAGNRLQVDSPRSDAVAILAATFGVAAVEIAESVDAADFSRLVARSVEIAAPAVVGRTFAVRPRRLGKHPWRSQDLAVAVGAGLVDAGGVVDLAHPEVTVSIRVSDAVARVSTVSHPGAGGLPAGTQGRALMLFSGGIDSPVAAFLVARRGVALDHLHFSLGCGQADHAAGIAHLLAARHGAGTHPVLYVADLEPAAARIVADIPGRIRLMALKVVMYRVAERLADSLPDTRALITGESLGQVSTQTLDNLAALDRLVTIPVMRPLAGMGKQEISDRAAAIGTLELSQRSRELCDISGGGRVEVEMSPDRLAGIAADLDGVVEQTLGTVTATDLTSWVPGSITG